MASEGVSTPYWVLGEDDGGKYVFVTAAINSYLLLQLIGHLELPDDLIPSTDEQGAIVLLPTWTFSAGATMCHA